MRKRLMIILTLAPTLMLPAMALPQQNPAPKTTPAPKPPALTPEEKEILKHREILEKLELLQNFEKIQYLDFLADKKPSQNSNSTSAKPVGKDNANKTPNK